MKKVVSILLCVLLMSGCSSNQFVKDISVQELDDNVVKILFYCKEDSEMDANVKAAVKTLQNYGKENKIKMEVVKYTNEELSYSDYELKRNLMIQNKEADIIIDSADGLYQLRDKCGEYSKLNTYEKIWDNLKGYYCIPLFLYSHADKINNYAWEIYDIDSKDIKDVFSRQEYYTIKQQMKEKGARFSLNKCEIMELEEYYIIKNNVKIKESEGKFAVDKKGLKQTITEVYEDIKSNYNMFEEDALKDYESNQKIKDEVTGEIIRDWNTVLFKDMSNYENITDYVYNIGDVYKDGKSSKFSIFFDDIGVNVGRNFYYPSLFIRENSADEVYKAASILFEENYYKTISPTSNRSGFSPVIDTTEIRDYINVDDNWKYNGTVYNDDKKGVELHNRYYEMLRQEDMSNIFTSREVREAVPDFILEEIEKIMKQPVQINNLDKDIDDFIINTNIKLNS